MNRVFFFSDFVVSPPPLPETTKFPRRAYSSTCLPQSHPGRLLKSKKSCRDFLVLVYFKGRVGILPVPLLVRFLLFTRYCRRENDSKPFFSPRRTTAVRHPPTVPYPGTIRRTYVKTACFSRSTGKCQSCPCACVSLRSNSCWGRV